jgi:hypothetical protein
MPNLPPTNPNALLTREQAALALTEAGFPIKSKTLATKATRGGGPPFRHFGPRVLYNWADALAWAQSRLSEPRYSTSEADVAVNPASRNMIPSDFSPAAPQSSGDGFKIGDAVGNAPRSTPSPTPSIPRTRGRGSEW